MQSFIISIDKYERKIMPNWCLSDEAETSNMTFYIKMFLAVVIHSSRNHEQWNAETFFLLIWLVLFSVKSYFLFDPPTRSKKKKKKPYNFRTFSCVPQHFLKSAFKLPRNEKCFYYLYVCKRKINDTIKRGGSLEVYLAKL